MAEYHEDLSELVSPSLMENFTHAPNQYDWSDFELQYEEYTANLPHCVVWLERMAEPYSMNFDLAYDPWLDLATGSSASPEA